MSSEVFRCATPDDLPAIVSLKLAMFREAGRSGLLAEYAPAIILRDYQRLYQEEQAMHYIAECDGTLVAMVGAFLKSDLPFCYYQTPTYGFLGDVYTQPSHRQRGFATRLTEHALAWLTACGVTMVRLLATEAARPLYAAFGFQPSDEMVLHVNA